MTIRPYRNSEYALVRSWWESANEPPPSPGMMVEDGTFILERDGHPVLSLTVLLTQSNIAYFEGYVSSPNHPHLKSDGQRLWDHGYQYAKDHGCEYVFLYPEKEKLVKRYQELGVKPVLTGLTAMIRSL